MGQCTGVSVVIKWWDVGIGGGKGMGGVRREGRGVKK